MEGFNSKEQPRKLSEVQTIEDWRDRMITNREQIKSLVESPLLSACQELYDKNVRTTGSSANIRDIERGTVYITIDFDSLSQHNQEVAKKLGEVHYADEKNQVEIEIPVNTESTEEEIKSKADGIAHLFEKQPLLWANIYTLGDLRKMYGFDPDDEEIGIEDFSSEYFYDKERQVFFESEELYKKTTDQEFN